MMAMTANARARRRQRCIPTIRLSTPDGRAQGSAEALRREEGTLSYVDALRAVEDTSLEPGHCHGVQPRSDAIENLHRKYAPGDDQMRRKYRALKAAPRTR